MAYYSGKEDTNQLVIEVTKLDAALAQINSAIIIYFSWGDPVTVHTLATAAYGIVQGVNAARGGVPLTQDFAFIADKKLRRELLATFRAPQNFFKHADRDPNEKLSFLPYVSAYMLFEAIVTYSTLANDRRSFFEIFKAWFVLWGFGGQSDPFAFPESYRSFLAGLRKRYEPSDRKKYFLDELSRRFGHTDFSSLIGSNE